MARDYRPRRTETTSGQGSYQDDPALQGFDAGYLSEEARQSERAWRLYEGLGLRFDAQVEQVLLGALPSGHWAAVKLNETGRYTLAVESGAIRGRRYRFLGPQILPHTELVRLARKSNLLGDFEPQEWTKMEAWAEAEDARWEAEKRAREERWRRTRED